jgi:plastocyanin
MPRIVIERRNGVVTFDPDPADAVAGRDAVFWYNGDNTPHALAPDVGSTDEWTVGTVNPEHSSSQVNFQTAGEHAYRCTMHDGEIGTINVQ